MRISDWSSDVCSSDLLAAAQAQKEVTHNEALTLLDALVQPVVEAGPQNSPPLAPAVGQCWLVGAAPTAEWSEAAGTIALWTAGGWPFVEPFSGMRPLGLSYPAWTRFGERGWSRSARQHIRKQHVCHGKLWRIP